MNFKVGDVISNNGEHNALIIKEIEDDGEVFFELMFLNEKYNNCLWSIIELKKHHYYYSSITKLLEEYATELYKENDKYVQQTIEHFSFIKDLNNALERITKFVEGEL